MRIPDHYGAMLAHDALRLMRNVRALTSLSDASTRHEALASTERHLRELSEDHDTSPAERQVIDSLRRLLIEDTSPDDETMAARGWILYCDSGTGRPTARFCRTRQEAEHLATRLYASLTLYQAPLNTPPMTSTERAELAIAALEQRGRHCAIIRLTDTRLG